MIETADIYRAINELLEVEFPEIPVQDKDKKTPFPPCFYTQYVAGTTTQTAIEYETTSCSFNIVYFSAEQTIEDLINIEKKLKTIFKKPLKINFTDDRRPQYQEIENITTTPDEDNYTLNCSLNFSIDQLISDEIDVEIDIAGVGVTDFIDRYDEFNNEEYIEELEI